MKITTNYDPKPIPDRRFDWCAYDGSNYDVGSPTGYGDTEEDAIEDLLLEIEFGNIPLVPMDDIEFEVMS